MAKIPVRLENHRSVRAVRERPASAPDPVIDADWLRELCLAAGVDDVGFVSIDNPDLAGEVEHAENALPGTRSYISLVARMNRENALATSAWAPAGRRRADTLNEENALGRAVIASRFARQNSRNSSFLVPSS